MDKIGIGLAAVLARAVTGREFDRFIMDRARGEFLAVAGGFTSDVSMNQPWSMTVASDGTVQVHRVVSAIDAGHVIEVGVREQDRLRQGQATGQSPDTGGPTPTIERRRRGILEGIF